jgi:hypothetical protein
VQRFGVVFDDRVERAPIVAGRKRHGDDSLQVDSLVDCFAAQFGLDRREHRFARVRAAQRRDDELIAGIEQAGRDKAAQIAAAADQQGVQLNAHQRAGKEGDEFAPVDGQFDARRDELGRHVTHEVGETDAVAIEKRRVDPFAQIVERTQ